MPLKLSKEGLPVVHYKQLMRDPLNPRRKPETEEEKQQIQNLRKSVFESGVFSPINKSKQKDKETGKYFVSAGGTRVEFVYEAVEKKIFSENDDRAYIPYMNVEGNYFDPEIRLAAIFSDNDTRLNYTYKHIADIIIMRYDKRDILQEARHGYKSADADTFYKRVCSDLRLVSREKIRRAITVARKKISPTEKYTDLSREEIHKFNQQFEKSIWPHIQRMIRLEERMKSFQHKYIETKGKIQKDITFGGSGFPKGGWRAYVEFAFTTNQPDYRPIKQFKDLRKYMRIEKKSD